MTTVPSAKLVLIDDLKEYKIGDSVRVTGIWNKYESSEKIGVLEYKDIKVEIEMNKIEQEIPQIGELVQCLGEIVGDKRISARIIRTVNTLDMELYEQVVQAVNKF